MFDLIAMTRQILTAPANYRERDEYIAEYGTEMTKEEAEAYELAKRER